MNDLPEARFFNSSGYLPPMTSYAQNFEDVTLRRALQDIERGFYVDIGAWHPTRDSVTRWFYDQGWRGLNVEPNPHFLALLKAERPRDMNIGVAVGGEPVTTLHVVADTGLSTIDLALAASLSVTERIEVKGLPLDELLQMHEPLPTIDFLKIDAECSEVQIIRGSSFTTYRPRIVVTEAPGLHIYNPMMLERGYHFVWFDGLNAFYVRSEDSWRAELLARPPSVWDSFTLLRPATPAKHEKPEQREEPERRGRLQGLISAVAKKLGAL